MLLYNRVYTGSNAKMHTIFFSCSDQFELDLLKKTNQNGEKAYLDINELAKTIYC